MDNLGKSAFASTAKEVFEQLAADTLFFVACGGKVANDQRIDGLAAFLLSQVGDGEDIANKFLVLFGEQAEVGLGDGAAAAMPGNECLAGHRALHKFVPLLVAGEGIDRFQLGVEQ